jgi:hypothetical protein
MKFSIVVLSMVVSIAAPGQNVQLHYDMRHTFDPKPNPRNFPSLTFEYFKNIDTTGTGSFLFKMQLDLKEKKHNPGQVFTQISQSLRFWKAPVYLSLNYSGGLGISGSFGFNIPNSFGIGISYPFQWRGAWVALNLLARYNAFEHPSYDPQFTFYFGKGFFNYKIMVAGSIVSWTENRFQGNDFTKDLHGKKFSFFGDPQVWIKLRGGLSLGSRINLFYNLQKPNALLVYPTVGAKYQF